MNLTVIFKRVLKNSTNTLTLGIIRRTIHKEGEQNLVPNSHKVFEGKQVYVLSTTTRTVL